MLVLSRKIRESVVVGGASGSEQLLQVTVLEIHGGFVKLGFQADATVPVHRAEIWERMRNEQETSGPKPIAAQTKRRVPYID